MSIGINPGEVLGRRWNAPRGEGSFSSGGFLFISNVVVIEPFLIFPLDPFVRVGGLGIASGVALPDWFVEAVEEDHAAIGAYPDAVGEVVAASEVASDGVEPLAGSADVEFCHVWVFLGVAVGLVRVISILGL